MPSFALQRRITPTAPKLAKGVHTIRKGIGYLQAGDYSAASKEFRRIAASRSPSTSRLVRATASFYFYNTERARKETRKVQFGNSNLLRFGPVNAGSAWSDVDIAAVLIAPTSRFTTRFLSSFLGRTEEAIRFQRRYAFCRPLTSWAAESGSKYTRYTQTQRVVDRLGLS